MSRLARNVVLIAVLAVALVASGLLSLRAISVGRRVRAGEEQVRPWMSIPYISHSRHVPQSVLWNALGIAPHAHDHRPIGRIAKDQKRPLPDVISSLESAIEHAPDRHDRKVDH